MAFVLTLASEAIAPCGLGVTVRGGFYINGITSGNSRCSAIRYTADSFVWIGAPWDVKIA